MAGPNPPGFDEAEVRAGLLSAMAFGEPNAEADKATFYTYPARTVDATTDDEGVPFDPAHRVTSSPTPKTVRCAIEYGFTGATAERFGDLQPASAAITLLDVEYLQVKGFDFVVIGGQKFLYDKTEGPYGLGSIDVWVVHCKSEDQL